jgi:SGNH domain-containing protein
MSSVSRQRVLAAVVAAIAATVAVMASGVVATSSGQNATMSAAEVQGERCFGAASRDPERRCINKELRYTVVPTPEEARTGQNSPCTPVGRTEELYPCAFGTPWDEATKTIALVGDSHAGHWRAALDVVAQRRGWYGISLTQTGCPMTKAIPILKGRQRDDCLEYNEAIAPWLERHPEVTTVFTSQHGGTVVTAEGETQFEAQVHGFAQAFDDLPPSVKNIIVIRDTPWSTSTATTCIEEALAEQKRPDTTCAIRRSRALRPDLAVVAAHLMQDPRVKMIDMSDFMCGPNRCFPVVGGALVHKDGGHLTQVFSRTMGPYLGRYVDRVTAGG